MESNIINNSISSWNISNNSFYSVGLNGENMTRWIVTLILSIAFVVLGIIGIIDYKTQK